VTAGTGVPPALAAADARFLTELSRVAALIIGLHSVKPIDQATLAAADDLPGPGYQTS
jgi:transketolase C-terminal domain/subunit